jgi:hypothetical protein
MSVVFLSIICFLLGAFWNHAKVESLQNELELTKQEHMKDSQQFIDTIERMKGLE